MDTKLKGDVAEQTAAVRALRYGWGVLKPIGDRHPYDLVFDIGGRLAKIQVKSAWYNCHRDNYVVDTRRTKTNRREMKRSTYAVSDFDFALVYLPNIDLFYVFPVKEFARYASDIQLVECEKRQRPPNSYQYREAWQLILQWAAQNQSSG